MQLDLESGAWLTFSLKKKRKGEKKEVFLEGCTDRGRWRRCGSAHRGSPHLGMRVGHTDS